MSVEQLHIELFEKMQEERRVSAKRLMKRFKRTEIEETNRSR